MKLRSEILLVVWIWGCVVGGCSDEEASSSVEDTYNPFGNGGLLFDIATDDNDGISTDVDITSTGGDDVSDDDANGVVDIKTVADGSPVDGQGDGDTLVGADTVEPGFEYPCEPGAVESCETACGSLGKHKCLKEWGPCFPPDELCDNCVDDDCDGEADEECVPNPECNPVENPACAVPQIDILPSKSVGTGTQLTLSAKNSTSPAGAIVQWLWTVAGPSGTTSTFSPSANVESPTFVIDVAGQFLFKLQVWDEAGNPSCAPSLSVVSGTPVPPVAPSAGCADGKREGFLDESAYTHVAGCAGAWEKPGITPDSVVPTCGRKGGDDGSLPDGTGCSSADLCADGWHVCNGWQELALKSPSGCAGATPPDAKSKSIFFALRQPSENGSVCGPVGSGFNDVFGCGNLGSGLGPDKNCGPLDRVLASTIPDKCGFNEAEPPLGPWQCMGGAGSDLKEGQTVTKKGCPNTSCSYDGAPLGSSDKGGVLCCRD